jgi:hypothetical protein
MVLYGVNINLGLGVGGMERMIAYPILVWGTGFGGHLIAQGERQPSSRKP